jgi:ABC-2 type transport system ATP-binding protein
MVALLHNPKILILDEPTVGIDVHSRLMINTYLKKLNEGGITMIYTSHQLEEAEKLCDQLAIMDYGKVIAEGETQELLSQTEGQTLNDVFIHHTGNKLRD